MAGSLVVARLREGGVIKGTTGDFSPVRTSFHIQNETGNHVVEHGSLKAVFFVRDLDGDHRHQKTNVFATDKPAIGRKIAVRFADGEILVGTTQGYAPGRPGFFVTPADTESNTIRCFVLSAATSEVKMF